MKNILLLVHDDEGQEARLQAALDLTRALGGHLTCLDVTPYPMIAGDLYVGFGEAAILSDERESEAKNKTTLTTRLAQEDVSWSWIDATGDIAGCIEDAATLADLIVLNRALDDYPLPDMRTIASRILMHTRTVVVAVPENLPRFNVSGRVLVAWDGQSSAAATMRACVPLLRLASEVEIFMTRDGAEKIEPTEAAEYLSRHGIHASVRIIDDGLHAADQIIAEEARLWHADYVMMGAYSHGRLMETFGGVTKRMLNNSKLPMILGH
ncbi:universal stress protein [Sphingobium sp. BYY-5]|uniref:universal stress protein n=1 Tax=Sphingobium sp. BYY-5 TaxID=2926400 RepID=UPI001FA76944|nr:universal stress protein [Sphingobium sp. BYY-5]MCI4592467.1 universal stress protein [Sphingobium sp. BYY-5]